MISSSTLCCSHMLLPSRRLAPSLTSRRRPPPARILLRATGRWPSNLVDKNSQISELVSCHSFTFPAGSPRQHPIHRRPRQRLPSVHCQTGSAPHNTTKQKSCSCPPGVAPPPLVSLPIARTTAPPSPECPIRRQLQTCLPTKPRPRPLPRPQAPVCRCRPRVQPLQSPPPSSTP